ncbi:MAG TPA: S9 family peptidase [Pyrinomonadaceae bacterium]|nr:S9 family peptidase [Pyrinomonadaceae bacterium]
MHRKILPALVTLLILVIPLQAQQTDKGKLTLDRIFNSSEFRSETFGPARWLDDGTAYTTLEPSTANKNARDIVRYDAATGRREVLVPVASFVPKDTHEPLQIEDYAWSKDGTKLLIFTNSKQVWRQNTRGDYWVYDSKSKALTKLGGNQNAPSTLMFAKFSPDGTRVAYVRENNIYVENLADHRITQVTRDGSKRIINGTFDWVYEEELDLRDGWRWSPDGKSIAYWQLDTDGVPEYFLVNNTDSLYPKITPIQYPVAGDKNSAVRVGVVNATGGDTRWLQVPGDPRNNYIARMDWGRNSGEVILQHLNRLQNVLQVMAGNAQTGQVRTILTDKDDAWIDIQNDTLQWLDGGKSFLWISERDGWRHAYLASADGNSLQLITKGDFDIINIEAVDEQHGWLYFTASPENATQRYLYRTKLSGGEPERLTPATQPGTHSYTVAPGAVWAFHTYSDINTPPQIDLIHLPDHKPARMLAENAGVRSRVKELDTRPAEFVKVDIGDGTNLDGWIMKPLGFDSSKKYPVLIYVYGEPAAQTVLDRWASRNYLWHQMLAQHGYIVMSFDNRGTPAPKGRAWRKIVYRKIGVLAPEDQAAATKVVQSWPYVDPKRIAIWGWSGGGSMTLNQMFRYPEIYQVGMSVAPVSDQRFYDTIYQERYMGLPRDNGEDYRRGSPITYASALKGKLLIVHGSGDDNVHYKNTEALVNTLIAAKKRFTMMEYPNRRHDISQGEGTTRHLYELLTRFLEENLPVENIISR